MRFALLIGTALGLAGPQQTSAQDSSSPRGWEITGLPALNFDADEGFGYGALLQVYNYGVAGEQPYRFTIQPTVFRTTEGRRDYTLFFDAPHLLGGGWRLDATLADQKQVAAPYYGVGNATLFDETADEGANEYYYRYGRQDRIANLNLQRSLGPRALRLLAGAGLQRTILTTVPFDKGTTLLAGQTGGAPLPDSRANYVRAGLVWDTRDRETGPRRGTWADALVQRVDDRLGATSSYTRTTGTIRRYQPVTPRLTLAVRAIAQNVTEGAPFQDLAVIQSSYKQQEGLGGSGSIRGLPKNRFIGRGLFLYNTELRWQALDFRLRRKPAQLVLNGFIDRGRVWAGGFDAATMFDENATGVGGGARLALGPNFVVALDVAHSKESTAPIYLGLGYQF